MKTSKELLYKNIHFYIPNLLLLVCCSLFLLVSTRADGFILLNSRHSRLLTVLFQNITLFGDGLPIIIISLGILLFFKKHRKLAILLLMSYKTSSLLAQIISAFISSPRRSDYFEMHHYKYFLDTFANCRIGFKSFPSAHAAPAFATATVISFYFTRKYIWFFAFLYAVLIGYSRIYLPHHFLIDLFSGALLGILLCTMTPLWFSKLAKRNYWKLPSSWGNSPQLINNK